MVLPLFLFLLLAGSGLDPCACDVPSFDLAWKSSTAVFSGRLNSVLEMGQGSVTLQFFVADSWKGNPPQSVNVIYDNPSSCATTVFVVGKDYLIYAIGDQPLHVSHCSRSRLLSKAAEDLASLKEEQGPAPAAPRDPFVAMQGDQASLHVVKRIPRTLTINFAVVLAISHRGDEYFAVLKGSDGKTYTMKKGDALYDGRIASISPNTVTFVYKSGARVTKKLHPFSE